MQATCTIFKKRLYPIIMLTQIKYNIYGIVALLLLTACGGNNVPAGVQCPEIYILNKTNIISKAVPGFERTDRKLYQANFTYLKGRCKIDRKQSRIFLEYEFEFIKDQNVQAIPTDFAVFVSLLDKDKQLILREKFFYHPKKWKKRDKLLVTDQVQLSYPHEVQYPQYIYVGFVTSKAELRKNYASENDF